MLFNIIQLKCCGSKGPSDWVKSPYFKHHVMQYPKSCCPEGSVACSPLFPNHYKKVCEVKCHFMLFKWPIFIFFKHHCDCKLFNKLLIKLQWKYNYWNNFLMINITNWLSYIKVVENCNLREQRTSRYNVGRSHSRDRISIIRYMLGNIINHGEKFTWTAGSEKKNLCIFNATHAKKLHPS